MTPRNEYNLRTEKKYKDKMTSKTEGALKIGRQPKNEEDTKEWRWSQRMKVISKNEDDLN